MFGRIKCLRSVRSIKRGEELLVDYGYEAHEAPEWWTPTATSVGNGRPLHAQAESVGSQDRPQRRRFTIDLLAWMRGD